MAKIEVRHEQDRELTESLHSCKTERETADWVAARLGGAQVKEAKTTYSCYVVVGSAEVRLSDHSKYGSNHPMHVRVKGPAYKLLEKIRRAVIAAKQNCNSHSELRVVIENAKEAIRDSGVQYWRMDEPALRSLAGF